MEKNWFPIARKPVSTSQSEGFVSKIHFQCLKNKFPFEGKVKLSVAGASENGRKK